MEFLTNFLFELIPEGVEPLVFAVQFFFAIVAATMVLANDVRKRDKVGTAKPVDFKWVFLLKDNFVRVVAGAGVMWLLLYFTDMFLPEGSPKMMRYLVGAIVGAFGDFIWSRILKGLKDKTKSQLDKWFPK